MDNDMLIRVRRSIHTRCTPHHTQGMLACWTCCAGHQQSSSNAYIMHSDIYAHTQCSMHTFLWHATCTMWHARVVMHRCWTRLCFEMHHSDQNCEYANYFWYKYIYLLRKQTYCINCHILLWVCQLFKITAWNNLKTCITKLKHCWYI